MTETLTDSRTSALAYYERIGASLFPIPFGQKAPFGIVGSFKHDHSNQPETWKKWESENPGCNFGLVAFASHLIIADIDTSGGEAGRAEAWALWSDLCTSWGLPAPLSPHCQSQSGGWHCYLQVPSHIDAATLRQPDAVKKRINLRCVGYTVAAGSQFEGRPYLLMSEAPPHPAPAALVEHCTRAPVSRIATTTLPGSRDKGDVAALLLWLNEKGAFEDYESWFQIGMALRLEYGDDGFDLWELTHDGTVSPEQAASKWNSFATDPNPQSVTLATFLDRAHRLGWRGSVRKSTASMFSEVAQLAAASGASLSSGMPTPPAPGAMPMMAGQQELARVALPILTEFLSATPDMRPAAEEWPTLPVAMAGHDLYVPMTAALARIVALSEQPKFKPTAPVISVLIVLGELHGDVYSAIADRLNLSAAVRRKVKLGGKALADDVQRAFVRQDDWIYDARTGLPEHDNPDNVVVFLEIVGCEIRFNMWLEQMEICGGNDAELHWSQWTYIDDTIVAELRMRALREKTRFKMSKDFAWDALLSLSRKNRVDPALDTLKALQSSWDGKPRLSQWLVETCGVSDDAYHAAVSANIIGGMVRRIRQPGCKHDFMPVFYGPQGTGKSTIAMILADMGKSTLPEIVRRSTEWFSDEVLLGDASKELVLSLTGKCLVEIGEMGQRSSANIDHIKAMLSRQVDRGRTAYARSVSNRPRRNIFCGTVNGDEPLQDPTGNRRFLPIAVPNEVNLNWLSDNISQLIGEAATLEAAGADFALPRDVWATATERQEAARSQSDFEIYLNGWFLEGPTGWVTAADVASLLKEATGRSVAPNQYGKVMKALGFESKLARPDGRVWRRGTGARWTTHRDSSGRLCPRQMFGSVGAVPLPPGQPLPPLPY